MSETLQFSQGLICPMSIDQKDVTPYFSRLKSCEYKRKGSLFLISIQ